MPDAIWLWLDRYHAPGELREYLGALTDISAYVENQIRRFDDT